MGKSYTRWKRRQERKTTSAPAPAAAPKVKVAPPAPVVEEVEETVNKAETVETKTSHRPAGKSKKKKVFKND